MTQSPNPAIVTLNGHLSVLILHFRNLLLHMIVPYVLSSCAIYFRLVNTFFQMMPLWLLQ